MSLADDIIRMKKELRGKIHSICESYRSKELGKPLAFGEIIECLEMCKNFYLFELHDELEHRSIEHLSP